jgi:hypothetical protein
VSLGFAPSLVEFRPTDKEWTVHISLLTHMPSIDTSIIIIICINTVSLFATSQSTELPNRSF